jgi:hypothetical protein
MSRLVVTLLLAIQLATPTANAQEYAWARSTGPGLATIRASALDTGGNLLSLAFFVDSLHHGKTYYGKGNGDAALLKTAPDGTPLWCKVIGGIAEDNGISIACDSNGGTYIKVHSVSEVIEIDTLKIAGDSRGKHMVMQFSYDGQLRDRLVTTGSGVGTHWTPGLMAASRYGCYMVDYCDNDSNFFGTHRIDRGWYASRFGRPQWAYPWHPSAEIVWPCAIAATPNGSFFIGSEFVLAKYGMFNDVRSIDSADILIEEHGQSYYLQGYSRVGSKRDDRLLSLTVDQTGKAFALVSFADTLIAGDTVLPASSDRLQNAIVRFSGGLFRGADSARLIFDGELSHASLQVHPTLGYYVNGETFEQLVIGGDTVEPLIDRPTPFIARLFIGTTVSWEVPFSQWNASHTRSLLANRGGIYLSGAYAGTFRSSESDELPAIAGAAGFVAKVSIGAIRNRYDEIINVCGGDDLIVILPSVDSLTGKKWLIEYAGGNAGMTLGDTLSYQRIGGDTLAIRLPPAIRPYKQLKLFVTRLDPPSEPTAVQAYTLVELSPTVTLSGNCLISNYLSGNQWLRNGMEIPGATGRDYCPPDSGSYSVIVTSNKGCSAESEPVIFSPVSSVKTNGGFEFSLRGQRVVSSVSGRFTFRVTDVIGRELAMKALTIATNEPIDLSDLLAVASGPVFLHIEGETGRWLLKLMP